MDFTGKNVLVCGIGKSGKASSELLARLGARVVLQDIKEREKLTEDTSALERMGVRLYLGKNPDGILAEQDLLVLSPGIPCGLPFVERAAEMGVPVWGEIELAYRLCPAPIIAITGTNGKTTTTTLCYEILKEHNKGAVLAGNIGVPFTGEVSALNPGDYVVAEISSFQLETVHRFRPYIAAVLNMTPDHLNRHGTMENYVRTKERIFSNQQAGDFTILNYDDEICRAMAEKSSGKTIYFSRAETLAEGVFLNGGAIHASLPRVNVDEDIADINDLRIFGGHNVENALAATAATLLAGVPTDIIADGLKSFKGVEHRIEYVTERNGVKFYNDSKATNTDAAIKSLEAMKSPIVLICGGCDKHADFSGWVKLFEGALRCAVVIGEVSDQIIDTCRAYGFERYDRADTLKDAVELACRKACPGDAVLLSPACASFDMFDGYEHRGRLFKQYVREMRD